MQRELDEPVFPRYLPASKHLHAGFVYKMSFQAFTVEGNA